MCTGMEALALASMASSAAGTGAQVASQRSKRGASQDRAMAELERQNRMDEERFGNFQEALQRVDRDRVEGEAESAAGERTQRLLEASGVGTGAGDAPAGDYNISPALSTPKVIQDYARGRSGKSDDFVRALGEAKGRMGGWGDAMFDFGRDFSGLNRRNQDLRRAAQESGRIGKIEAEEAYENTGSGLGSLGNVLSTAGTVGSFAAGAGGGWGDLFRRMGGSPNAWARMTPASMAY